MAVPSIYMQQKSLLPVSAFRKLIIRSLRMKSRKSLSDDIINTSAKGASLLHETYTDTS